MCPRAVASVVVASLAGPAAAFVPAPFGGAGPRTIRNLGHRCQLGGRGSAAGAIRVSRELQLQPLRGRESDEEIFYDDFAGESIGEGASFFADASALEDPKQEEDVELPDFDDDEDGTQNRELVSIPLPKTDATEDLTGATLREFSFGPDIMLSNYAGSLGFDQVTDWQYYATDEYSGERTPVSPRPMDPSQPARTRSSSGSVVRLFRGEVGGALAGKLRSRGLDPRVWIKEYVGEDAVALARAERKGLGRLQSAWLKKYLEGSNKNDLLGKMEEGEWLYAAQRRYVDGLTDTPTPKDDENLMALLEWLASQKAPFAALLGVMNLSDYYDDESTDPNEWYKSLGVKPPQPGSIWLVFDYHGISTAASYAVPHLMQRSKLPPKRGPFGGIVEAPPLPPFKERARYVVQGVLKGMLGAVATAHEAGIVHRSIGRNSFILSSVGQDKQEATSPYAVVTARLRVILTDWGFAATTGEAARDKELGVRQRSFNLPSVDSYEDQVAMDDRITVAAEMFAKAEDLHALGFVFLAMLFTTLAEPATPTAPMPSTDDDTWQRLFGEIFNKDMVAFRDYCESEDVWDNVVELLDRQEGAGWDLLGSLLLSRERLSTWYNDEEQTEPVSADSLLSHPFFAMKII
ncbi:hypothetical protein ACHAXT_010514 [Thalassiosira profunda]